MRGSPTGESAARPVFFGQIVKRPGQLARVVALGAEFGVPMLRFSSALAYYDGYRSERLPAEPAAGQRDFFGAHTYERVDQPRGKFFHLDWPKPTRPQLPV
jgi:6-phosphogluconate dehydrogenase